MLVPNEPVPVILLELDEEFNHTGVREPFDSQSQAGRKINISPRNISQIRNPEKQQTTIIDKRTGLPVTFIHAESTEEEIEKWLKHVKNSRHPYAVRVKLLKLDSNFKYTGEFKIFDNEYEAEKYIDNISQGIISKIINPKLPSKTITNRKTGLPVTFVHADATEKEINERLKEIETKGRQTKKTKVVYVKSGKIQYFSSIRKTSKATGIPKATIESDINNTYDNPKKRYHKDTGEEIKFYEA